MNLKPEIEALGKQLHTIEKADIFSVKPLALDAFCRVHNILLKMAELLEGQGNAEPR